MDFEAKYLQLAAQLGFVACRNKMYDEARNIFEGLRDFRPEQECPVIGLASVDMATGKSEQAIELLEKDLLSRDPESVQGRTYKGMALMLSGDTSGARELLSQVTSGGAGEEYNLADHLLKTLIATEQG